ncbi:hypothetical protein BGZ83_006217 [Gryganskiella cystojenkinii]|nr:hypothetical protein BGZ83_006217 [Gryganskiella cystojenkinii]
MDTSPSQSDAEIAIALRKRSLMFWLTAAKEQPSAKVVIPNSKPVCGRFVSMDAQEQRVRIDVLQTPIGTYEHVVLRGGDVDALELTLG